VQDARPDQPAAADLQAIRLRQVEDAVVALVPILQALADLRLGGAGVEAHERVREIVADVVVLRREVIALGLALLLDQRRLLARLVHVVRDRAHVVEEFGIDRPLLVLVQIDSPMIAAPSSATASASVQRWPAWTTVAESFVRRAIVVGGGRGRAEPALVDPAAVQPEGVQVLRVEFERLPG
jgi:hypothetical protein